MTDRKDYLATISSALIQYYYSILYSIVILAHLINFPIIGFIH